MKPLFCMEEWQSLQGYWRQSFHWFRAKLTIFSLICGGFLVFVIVLVAAQAKSSQAVLGGGLLQVGSMIAGSIQVIGSIFDADRQKIKSKLVFPLNRKVYFLGNFFVAVRDTAGLLIVTSVFAAMELLAGKVLKIFQPDLYIANLLNVTNYWNGLWITLSVIVLIYAFCYCISAYLSSAKIKTWFIIGIFIAPFFIRLDGGDSIATLVVKTIFNFITAQHPAAFYLKTWLLNMGVYLLAYFPIRRLEV